MDACTFDMLHNTGNQYLLAVAYRVDLYLLPLQIFVHQDRMVLSDPVDDPDKLVDIVIIDGDLHPLAAQHIRRPYQDRITKAVRNLPGFFGRVDRTAAWPWDLTFLQNLIE